MVNFGKKVVKYRVLILIVSILLRIPAGLGYLNTRVNYDVLTYLPDNIETMQGQDILVNDFNTGAFSMFIVDGMHPLFNCQGAPRYLYKLRAYTRYTPRPYHSLLYIWSDFYSACPE